jgi:hypothetical protein
MLRVTDISPGVTYNAELQAGSQQFYRITIPSGNVKLTASIESSIATVIELYNGNGERITYNNSGKNVKVSPYYALLVGEYFIKVAGYYNTTAGSYSLHVTTEAVTR